MNKTEVIFLLDKSGSMSSIKNDMEGAISEFVADQKRVRNNLCYVTLIEFDYPYTLREDGYVTVFRSVHIDRVPKIKLEPRGNTALLDSLCRAIDETSARLATQEEKPNNIYFVIITDGEENASRRYGRIDVKQRIEHQTIKYGWNFRYFGANQNALYFADNIGIKKEDAATYNANKRGVRSMGNVLSADVTRTRLGEKRTEDLQFLYDEEEKQTP